MADGIFGDAVNDREKERCLEALKVVMQGNILPLLTCFDDYHIWEKMRFGLPNFHGVFGLDPEYLSVMAAKLHALNSEGIFGDKRIVRRG